MFKLLLIIFGFVTLLTAAAFLSAKFSQAAVHRPQEQKDRLRPCPESPNCISSENNGITPIPIEGKKPEVVWAKLRQTITEQGGQLLEDQPRYLWATFKTPFFGFIDDVEARLDLTDNIIHIRSSSRIGYYDFGTNRKRLLNIKAKLQINLDSTRLKNTHE